MSNASDFLVASLFAAALSPALSAQDPTAKLDFQKQVLPIFEHNCVECHRAPHTDESGRERRPKGGVVFDSKAGFEQGRPTRTGSEPLFVAGKPDESLIVHMVTLPVDDDDHMPPSDKKDPLTDDEVKTLKQWIAEGATFGDWVGNKAAPGGAGGERGGRFGPTASGRQPREDFLTPLGKDLKPVAAAVIEKAAAGKARIEPLGADSPLLRVSYMGHEDEVTDAEIAALAPLADHVVMLSIGRTKITDDCAPTLAKMKRLVRLDVRETAFGDKGVKQLTDLPELRMLNLFGCKATDAGVAAVGKAAKLQQLYVWQTGVSEAAVEKLKKERPELRVLRTAELPLGGERGERGQRGDRGQRRGQRGEGGEGREREGGEKEKKEGGGKGGE